MIKELNELYEDAIRIYKANGRKDYEAGIVQGIKRAIEVVEREADKIRNMGNDLYKDPYDCSFEELKEEEELRTEMWSEVFEGFEDK